MGQRLVVSIDKSNKTIAALYFHWSAYTGDALYVTRDIIHCIYNKKDETERDMLLRLIHFYEGRHGGIDSGDKGEAWKYITTMYPGETFKSEGINRSDGLIALDEKTIADMKRISEGDVHIDLDTDQVYFYVYCGYDNLNEYIAERKSWDEDFEEFTLEELPYIDHCLGCFGVEEIDDLIKAFEETEDNQNVINFGGEIVELS
jgi:hypothetical protein